ncbi:S-adenosylmethionine-homocysteine S-methyltransferase [Saccharomycopsis crataegensis]|uniref:S-adenosylmethionine-homocysteine S-methyltransferase n=1 Tax=Saccharomycopsis crataegensis TaxID=43959 RepID=A0AAV5QE78_9ASCO|nr:S-adenosylmethionine-homocysteine S-methyltransferase [Saccharomycopsis crataegensis]
MVDSTPAKTEYQFESLDSLLKNSKKVITLDGGLGTELESRGLEMDSALWSSVVLVKQPQDVACLHRDYYESGANLGISCSYQASSKSLSIYGNSIKSTYDGENIYDTEAKRSKFYDKCMDALVKGRDEAVEGKKVNSLIKPLISGSIGPYGAALSDGSEFTGTYCESESFYKEFHSERLRYFTRHPEVDLLIIETIPVFGEIKAVVSLLEEDLVKEGIAKPYLLSMSIRDSKTLADGTPIAEVVKYLSEETSAFKSGLLLAIGGNCLKLRYSVDFLKNLQSVAPKGFPLSIYPNSGEIYDGISKGWSIDPELGDDVAYEWENIVKEWIKYGARFVGGCCRVGVADIARIHKTIVEYNETTQ